jgi:regulatory protein
MKITALRVQVKTPERISIFVDGKYSFSLSLDQLIEHRLKKDQELDQQLIDQYKKLSAEGKLRIKALNWLLSRPHSVKELKTYLHKHKTDPEFSQSIIEDFTRRGYLDDKAFAKFFMENRLQKNRSNRYITGELRQKGISSSIIDELLSDLTDQSSRLEQLITKKMTQARYRDKAKLTAYLQRQGFSYQDIISQLKSRE